MPAAPDFSVPESLSWLRQHPGGGDWLSRLPGLLEIACARFRVSVTGPAFTGGCVSLVVPVQRGSEEAVLKLQFIDRESRFEADALRIWNGVGAIRLIAHDGDIGAMLLERCRPGRFLADDADADHLGVLAGLLRQLQIPAGAPITSLKEEARHWMETLPGNWEQHGQPCEKRLVDAAVSALAELVLEETAAILLHQDLHGHNVLSAEREPWLAIDPKPLAGDPAFALSPIVRSFEFGHSRKATLYRLDRLSEELSLDRDRARLWTVGQTMAWGFGGDFSQRHFQTVRWLLD